MPDTIATNILEYLKGQEDTMLEFLGQLVAMETPSGDVQSQEVLFGALGRKFNELGFKVFRMPGKQTGGYLYARPAERSKEKPLQLLVGHCDTVWKRHTLQTMPVNIKGGKMTGPGVYDMKAGLTQMVFSLIAVRELKLNLPLTPLVLVNSDEEIGSRESGKAIQRFARISERAFILEPPLGLEGKLKTARKGLGRFTITVKGKAAHAGLDPGKGLNAIVELSSLVQQLYAMNDFEKGITVNVGTIQGGVSPNVVAPESSAVIDVRVLNTEDGERITREIQALRPSLPGISIHIEGGMGRQPMERTPRNRKLWEMAKQRGALLGLKLEEGVAGGGSDGNTTSLFTATLDGLGTTGDGAHATHEHIITEDLCMRTALLTLLLTSARIGSETTSP